MKSIMLEVSVEGELYLVNRLLTADPSIICESLHHIIIFKGGTIIPFYHSRGGPDQVRTYLTDYKEVTSCDVPENGSGPVYIHSRPLKPICEFFPPTRSYGTVFETSIAYTDDGLKITMSGDGQTLHRVISEVLSDTGPTLLRKGERKSGENVIISLLTERQVGALTLAAEEGYYEISGGTTHEKIATQIGAATTTVSEYLRKVKQRIFSALIR